MAIVLPITGQPGSNNGGVCNPFPKGSCATYIGWDNILHGLTPSGQSSGDGSQAVDWRPYTRWTATDGGTGRHVEFQLSEAKTADYFAFQGYELQGSEVRLDYHNGTAWVNAMLVDSTLLDGEVVFRLFSPVTSDRWRVRLTHPTAFTSPTWFSVLSVGQVLVLPSQPVGFTPPALARDTKLLTSWSEAGLPLGRSRIRVASEFEIVAEFISIEWAVLEWKRFIAHAERYPFFFWWDVGGADDACLCWAHEEIPAVPWSTKLHLEARMPVRGLLR